MKTIKVSDEVYDYLKGMIDDEHVANGDSSPEINENGEACAYRPTFSEVISHLIEDRELATVRWQITYEQKAALGVILARIEYDQSLPGRFNYTVSRAKDTLRAMLEEAQP